ncbi:hypothetical protein [Paenibacillus taiwanensis]|nr:hypothetical protein [Paenibacillus taiwanensis]
MDGTLYLTGPERHVSVRDGNGLELGIIVEPQEMDELGPSSKKWLADVL